MSSDTAINSAFVAAAGTALLAVDVDPMLWAGAAVMALGGLGALAVQVFNAWAGAQERIIAASERKIMLERTEIAAKKATEFVEKAGNIEAELQSVKHTGEASAKNVDGNLSALREELARQTSHSAALQSTVDTLAGIIRAQAATSIVSPAGVPSSTDESLKNIDQSTVKIEQNTARTDATVQDLKKE